MLKISLREFQMLTLSFSCILFISHLARGNALIHGDICNADMHLRTPLGANTHLSRPVVMEEHRFQFVIMVFATTRQIQRVQYKLTGQSLQTAIENAEVNPGVLLLGTLCEINTNLMVSGLHA